MSDQEWIAEVRKYAVRFGHYNFTVMERQRIAPYLRGALLHKLHEVRFALHFQANLPQTYALMDAVEEGIAAAVAAKLTGGRVQ